MQYVKYISNVQVQEPPQNKDGIINYNLNIDLLIQDGYKPLVPAEVPSEEEIRMYHFEYNELPDRIEEVVIFDETTEEAEARIIRVRREYLDQLTLTPSDVERALYYSDLHMDFDDLKALIAQQAPQIDLKGLAIEFRANNFYRGAEDKNGNRIIDMVGQLLGFTAEQMDYLFEHKQLPPTGQN